MLHLCMGAKSAEVVTEGKCIIQAQHPCGTTIFCVLDWAVVIVVSIVERPDCWYVGMLVKAATGDLQVLERVWTRHTLNNF